MLSRKASLILIAWAVAVTALFGQLIAYSAQPGAEGRPPRVWPDSAPGVTPLQRADGRWTALIFAHPRCPCTRATLAEFARLHRYADDQIDATLIVYHPTDATPAWAHGRLTDAARRIDGLDVVYDPGAGLSRRFGVETSGHVLAYNPQGELAYSGGLTRSRGHEGRAYGAAQLAEAIEGGRAAGPIVYPVFGCRIAGPGKPCVESGCGQP